MSAPIPRHIVVMGVSGTGKTTIGSALGRHLGVPFAEGDAFHSEEARRKMASGRPLTDDDRWPWLRRLRDWMSEQGRGQHGSVVACSALRRVYRDVLREARGEVVFCHLTLDRGTLASRVANRPGHYMPVSLLASQLSTLEPLDPDEQGVALPADADPDETLARILAWLGNLDGSDRDGDDDAR